jgi:predicted membrane-bound spermidine synthase
MKSLSFSLPALLGGLLVAYFINIFVRYILFSLSENSSSYYLSGTSVVLGVLIGILLPSFSNIIPIERALSKNLRNSLDLYHRAINEVTVSIKRIEDMGLSVN